MCSRGQPCLETQREQVIADLLRLLPHSEDTDRLFDDIRDLWVLRDDLEQAIGSLFAWRVIKSERLILKEE